MLFLVEFVFHKLFYPWRQGAALSSAIKHAMPLESGGKYSTEFNGNESTLLCMGNSVTLKKIYFYLWGVGLLQNTLIVFIKLLEHLISTLGSNI